MTISPVLRMSFGLVGLAATALILSDMFFGIVPDPNVDRRAHRAALAELATAHVIEQLAVHDYRSIAPGLDAVRQRVPEIIAVAIRDSEGKLVAASGAAAAKTLDHVVVPINSAQGQWGLAEFAFEPQADDAAAGWPRHRWIWLALGLVAGLVLLTYLYLRRALFYLDPMSVVPDRLRTAFDGLTEAIALLDRGGRVVLANRAMRAIASIEDNKLHGRRLDAAVAMELPGDAATRPWQAVITSGEAKLGVQVHLGSGAERKTGNMNCTPILDGRGKVRGCLVAVSDVTAIEKSNDQLRRALAQLELSSARVETQNQDLIRLAMYDGLTSLHNRGAFFQAAREAVARQAATGSTVAVLMIDVDHFKSFNDRFGHATGDIVLQRVAKCLADTIRFNDLAGRYGGEEFCALVENLDRAGVLALAERIRKTIQAQAGLGVGDGAGLSVTVSIGVAISPPAAGELAGLIKLADEALYASKHGGRNRVTLSGAAEPMGRDQAGTGQTASAISLGEGVSRA